MSIKEQLAQAIEGLPESITIEEAFERLYRAFKLKQAMDRSRQLAGQRYDWMAVRGIAPGLTGEDAQSWVSRSRTQADEQRERQWRPSE